MDWLYFLIWIIAGIIWSGIGYVNAFATGKEKWIWTKFARTMLIGIIVGGIASYNKEMITQDIYLQYLANPLLIPFVDKILAWFKKLL